MSCKKYIEMISLLALGELSLEQQEELERHCAVCDDCRRDMQEVTDVVQILSQDDNGELTDTEQLRLENEVLRQLLSKAPARTSVPFNPVTRVLLRVAAAVAIFLFGYGLFPLLSHLTGGSDSLPGSSAAPMLAQFKPKVADHLRFSEAGLRLIAKGRTALAGDQMRQ